MSQDRSDAAQTSCPPVPGQGGVRGSGGAPAARCGSLKLAVVRALITGCAVAAAMGADCPWPGIAGLGLLGAVAVAAEMGLVRLPLRGWRGAVAAGCALSLLVPATPLFKSGQAFSFAGYVGYFHAMLGWVTAVCIVPLGVGGREPGRLRVPAMTCAGFSTMLWLATAWTQNLRGSFYLALLVSVALLVLGKHWFRLPVPVVIGVNTLLLLICVIGGADLVVPPPPRLDPQVGIARKFYSYEHARKDPLAFARWWSYFLEELLHTSREVIVPAHHQTPGCYLRPNARSHFFESTISINSLGYRGPEFSKEKGDAYRIVALGESTTYGLTIGANDRPWPEVLEGMIRDRLHPARPVQVINAGIPAVSLAQNVHRLAREIMPLKPDMIISYHGYNGLPSLDESLPVVEGPAQPLYHPRPLRLVANCEYRIKMLLYRRRVSARPAPHPQVVADVMKTPYARAYEWLVDAARTNGVRLVLGNFSLAVNEKSDPDVVDFYHAGFPAVKWLVAANSLHSSLVQAIARQNPQVILVDTHPGLDGCHEKFIDLMHLTQEGRQQLAENFYAGIKATLEHDLSVPEPARAAN